MGKTSEMTRFPSRPRPKPEGGRQRYMAVRSHADRVCDGPRDTTLPWTKISISCPFEDAPQPVKSPAHRRWRVQIHAALSVLAASRSQA